MSKHISDLIYYLHKYLRVKYVCKSECFTYCVNIFYPFVVIQKASAKIYFSCTKYNLSEGLDTVVPFGSPLNRPQDQS